MRKISILAATAAVVVSAGMFISCTKDGETLGGKRKVAETTELGMYEDYFPEESIVHEKLLQITEYMNEPGAEMPDMELKEAVWFLEAFFNIGLCSHQEYSMGEVVGRKTYEIDIPYTNREEDGTGEGLFLNGMFLQERYRNLLNEIIAELFGEYVVNFGDMYVQELFPEGKLVRLSMTVLYGHKCAGEGDSRFKILKIATPWDTPILAKETSGMLDYTPRELSSGGKTDWGMEKILNQESIYHFPWGIKKHSEMANPDYYNNSSVWDMVCKESIIDMDKPIWEFNHVSWKYDAPVYRDYIFNDLSPTLPYCYEPFWACCIVYYKPFSPSGHKGTVLHNFGIEWVYQTCALAIHPEPIWINDVIYGAMKVN